MVYEDNFKKACIIALENITSYLQNVSIRGGKDGNLTEIVNTIIEGEKLLSTIKKL